MTSGGPFCYSPQLIHPSRVNKSVHNTLEPMKSLVASQLYNIELFGYLSKPQYLIDNHIDVTVFNKLNKCVYTHTSIYSMNNSIDGSKYRKLSLDSLYNLQSKDQLHHSEFMHSNWIMLSTIHVLNSRVCLHFSSLLYTAI